MTSEMRSTSTTSRIGRTLTLGLIVALVCSSATAQASAPAVSAPVATSAASAVSAPVATPAAPAVASESAGAVGATGSIEEALAAGDLSAARELAEAARRAKPGVDTWATEADVCERQGDLACARAARAQQRALAPEGSPERAAAEARLAALEDMSRGTAGDEPVSTQRAELDAQRAARDLVKPPPKLDKAPVKAPPRERIVKKWYFWVTILAIAASGAAITGIAIKAANDERKDSLDASAGRVRPGPLDHGFGLRF